MGGQRCQKWQGQAEICRENERLDQEDHRKKEDDGKEKEEDGWEKGAPEASDQEHATEKRQEDGKEESREEANTNVGVRALVCRAEMTCIACGSIRGDSK